MIKYITAADVTAAGVDLAHLSATELEELEAHLKKGTFDFDVSDIRFIDETVIDAIQAEELRGDPYLLGSFTAWLIADCLNVSTECIESLQGADDPDAIGELLLGCPDAVEQLQQEYAAADGYGAHFCPDGNATECGQYVICQM